MPTVCFRYVSPNQSRSVRGENCELASCTATSIIDNNRVIEVMRPPAKAEKTETTRSRRSC